MWTPEKLAEQKRINDNAPSCSSCGANVMRPKCLFELNPADCPRHEQRDKYLATVKVREAPIPVDPGGATPERGGRRSVKKLQLGKRDRRSTTR